jgi:hypothetical protein
MVTKQEVKKFLDEFKLKMDIYNILFRDERGKNTRCLLNLDIAPNLRKEIVKELAILDYSEGPMEDDLYKISPMWVFGKKVKSKEIYIKISLGVENSNVICISFHEAEHAINYPFKNNKL